MWADYVGFKRSLPSHTVVHSTVRQRIIISNHAYSSALCYYAAVWDTDGTYVLYCRINLILNYSLHFVKHIMSNCDLTHPKHAHVQFSSFHGFDVLGQIVHQTTDSMGLGLNPDLYHIFFPLSHFDPPPSPFPRIVLPDRRRNIT